MKSKSIPNRESNEELISCLAVERLAAHLLAGRALFAALLVAGVSLTVSGPLAFHVYTNVKQLRISTSVEDPDPEPIPMFLGLLDPDPDPVVRGTDPDPSTSN
jgi:hypothetical protein